MKKLLIRKLQSLRLGISPFLFFLWGVTFLSFSFTIIKDENFIVLLLSALPIWLSIIIVYLIIYCTIKLIIKSKRKTNKILDVNQNE